ASAGMLAALPVGGAIAAAAAACGVLTPAMLAAAWLALLSLDLPCGLSSPWESMLLEAGFLAVFLPPLAPLPALTAIRAPQPILMFAFHWLLFRVMFGIGTTAFTRDTIREPRYLRGLLISQPVPTPLAWRAVGAPRWLLAIAHTALVANGIVLPFLVFFPGWPRWMAAAAFAATMIALQAFANLGFFNLIVIVLAVPLLDAR